jgi:hypothetical protein
LKALKKLYGAVQRTVGGAGGNPADRARADDGVEGIMRQAVALRRLVEVLFVHAALSHRAKKKQFIQKDTCAAGVRDRIRESLTRNTYQMDLDLQFRVLKAPPATKVVMNFRRDADAEGALPRATASDPRGKVQWVAVELKNKQIGIARLELAAPGFALSRN